MPWQVIKSSIKNVTTDYVSFCGDDDFIVPNTFGKIISILDNKKEFVSAIGDIYIASLSSNLRHIEYFYPYNPAHLITNTKISRIHEILDNYKVSLFAVFRLDSFQEILKFIPNKIKLCPTKEIADEIIPCLIAGGLGKTFIIDELFILGLLILIGILVL